MSEAATDEERWTEVLRNAEAIQREGAKRPACLGDGAIGLLAGRRIHDSCPSSLLTLRENPWRTQLASERRSVFVDSCPSCGRNRPRNRLHLSPLSNSCCAVPQGTNSTT